jgi:hypothetical protein
MKLGLIMKYETKGAVNSKFKTPPFHTLNKNILGTYTTLVLLGLMHD